MGNEDLVQNLINNCKISINVIKDLVTSKHEGNIYNLLAFQAGLSWYKRSHV